MSASNSAFGARFRQVLDYTPVPDLRKGPRGWWASPPRPGIYRLIAPWAYRHLRFYGVGHIAGGAVAATAGVICLSYGVNRWAAFFLVPAALNLAGGCWYLTLARSTHRNDQGQIVAEAG
jgi:hypothetical protein